jgi:hypothetical protein
MIHNAPGESACTGLIMIKAVRRGRGSLPPLIFTTSIALVLFCLSELYTTHLTKAEMEKTKTIPSQASPEPSGSNRIDLIKELFLSY